MFCVIDVGTTSMRAAVLNDRLEVVELERRPNPPSTPFPGLVEFDPAAMAATAIEAATAVIERAGGVVAVGLATQRASTVLWDRVTGEPLGPGLGWQDLRTVMECVNARDHGLALAPNQTATKAAWLLANVPAARDRDVCVGTVDSWLAWTLTGGKVHVTDNTNAGVTGLTTPDASAWSAAALDALGIPAAALPRIVPTVGVIAEATALPGAPPLGALVGDQQASLVGQGCVRPGATKATFGTGGMLDACTGSAAPTSGRRLPGGTFPIVAWTEGDRSTWAVEGIMLAAGSNIDWLVEDLGLVATPAASHDLAATVTDSNGAVFVPALLGLGTPRWDYGARGTLLGATRGTTSAHVVRAVLDGIANRGADLVEAAVADTGIAIDAVRIDGGMSANPTFVQAFADLSGRPIEVSPVLEATMRGGAFLAGLAIGLFSSVDDAGELWIPATVVEPTSARAGQRERWAEAVGRAAGWIPELSAFDF